MADLNHWWGSDLSLATSGDVATIDGLDRTRQRIVRRLCTSAGGDMFNPTYGAGLPKRIGEIYDVNAILTLINSQIMREASVDPSVPPAITVQGRDAYLYVYIQYLDKDTGAQATLTFEVSNPK